MTPRREWIGTVIVLVLSSLAVALILVQLALSFFMETPQ